LYIDAVHANPSAQTKHQGEEIDQQSPVAQSLTQHSASELSNYLAHVMNASGRRLLAGSRYSLRFAGNAIMFGHYHIIALIIITV